jgi:hypothetical protein
MKRCTKHTSSHRIVGRADPGSTWPQWRGRNGHLNPTCGDIGTFWSDTRRNDPGGKDDNLVEHTRDSWDPADHFSSDLPKLLSLHPAAD